MCLDLFRYVMSSWWILWIYLQINLSVNSMKLEQWYDGPSASEANPVHVCKIDYYLTTVTHNYCNLVYITLVYISCCRPGLLTSTCYLPVSWRCKCHMSMCYLKVNVNNLCRFNVERVLNIQSYYNVSSNQISSYKVIYTTHWVMFVSYMENSPVEINIDPSLIPSITSRV